MTFVMLYGPASCEKKRHSEHQTLSLLFGEGLHGNETKRGWEIDLENSINEL